VPCAWCEIHGAPGRRLTELFEHFVRTAPGRERGYSTADPNPRDIGSGRALMGMHRSSWFALLLVGACVFPMSRADLEAASAQHVARMCHDLNYAYETGFNAGQKRHPLQTGWVDTGCAPERRASVRERYHAGYEAGIANAPIVVPVPAHAAEGCTFSSDCGDGRTCRGNRCMGEGYSGDACWFGSDCLSGSCHAQVCR
jgi:hypothetical protein